MPQWAGSCWYYLRYLQPWNAERPVDPEVEKYWLPVDLYVGEQPCCQDTFSRRCIACSFSMAVTEQQAVRSRGAKSARVDLAKGYYLLSRLIAGLQVLDFSTVPNKAM